MTSRRPAFLATLGSGADLAIRQGAQLAVSLALARLVTPEEFGTIALLAVFVLIGSVVADAGISVAILQSRKLADADLDTAFWSSIALGALITGLAALLATPLASAFGRPELAGLAAILSVSVVLGAVGLVPSALLVKRLAFGRLMVVGLLAIGCAGGAAISLAVSGRGLWALTVQFVVFPAMSSCLLLLFGGYRPRPRWDRHAAIRLLMTGRWVVAANLVDNVYLRFQTVVLGWAFGAATLGRYQRADSTQQIAADGTSTVVGRVALPLFARSANRPELLRQGMRTGIRSTTVVNAPLMALLAAVSTQALVTVFGPQWGEAGPILTVLCLAGLLSPMHVLAISVLYSVGLNQVVFRIDLVKKGFGAVALVIGVFFGVTGVAWAQVGLSVFALFVNARAVHRAIGFGLLDEVREAAPPTVLAAIVGLAVAVLGQGWNAAPAVETIALGGGGALTYVVAAYVLRLRALHDLLPLLRRSRETATSG